MKRAFLAAALGTALLASLTPPAQAVSITITASAVGTIIPVTAIFPANVANGDFTIVGSAAAPLVGNGIDEATVWTFNFSGDADLAAFHAAGGPLTAASLTMGLFPRHALITTDIVRIDGLADIVTPAIQALPVDAIGFVALDLLDFYAPADILTALAGLATLAMTYSDDAVVFQAVMELTRVTVDDVPAPASLLLLLAPLAVLVTARRRRAGALALACLASAPASALVVTLGDQDFADGAFVASGPFAAASAGEPAPFDGFRGNDNDTDFSATWSFAFPAAAYSSAVLRLGIYDHDSASPGSQVNFFAIEGSDTTPLLDAIFEGSGGAQGEVNVYDIPIPALLLALLADGDASFDLVLEGITISTIGVVLPNNGAGLDFAQLLLDETAVPAPPALPAFAAALAALLVRQRAAAKRVCAKRPARDPNFANPASDPVRKSQWPGVCT